MFVFQYIFTQLVLKKFLVLCRIASYISLDIQPHLGPYIANNSLEIDSM